MAKKNVKEWIKEHERDIRDIAWYALGVIAGYGCYAVANRIMHRSISDLISNKPAISILLDSDCKYNGAKNRTMFTGICKTPLKPEELGELGNGMLSAGCDSGCVYTHFIALGEDLNKK